MYYPNKAGFTLVEALLAFFLFSFILVLYVPGLSLEIDQIQRQKSQHSQWRLLYELAQVTLPQRVESTPVTDDDDLAGQEEEIQVLLESYQTAYNDLLTDYQCNREVCYLSFESGHSLGVLAYESTD
ncbi:prepilin-type N-terminal cleavage/methylation domain-containing protein [Eremococcus coleocola]|uniref:Prepilin-type cleavage/methylation N-terminal domain protein n=1 Tax=Eremococcus coleocola ACS-139-V-Col8 TaxID=908337 RepID=E4KNJ8_9LACT|nr:prepilin-type N-terminal cleavage/methylation domain-containing protein [Eremococcus coleocola]EFR31522.1 prepilin-type cleavage/methylation N-terminal domain protein [Eremococcus coleocola ACS-139-V-Col8]